MIKKNNQYNIFALLNNEKKFNENNKKKCFLSYKDINNESFDIKLIYLFIIRIQSIYRKYFIKKKIYFLILEDLKYETNLRNF